MRDDPVPRSRAVARAGALVLAVCGLLGWLAVAFPAAAQIETPRPLDLPDFPPPERPPGPVLPPIPLPEDPDTEGLDAGVRVFIRGVRITGNTVFSDEELARYARPYENRVVSSSDLAMLRDQLTQVYIDAGYISSGAILPDQSLEDGIVEFRILENALTDIVVSTDGFFRPGFIRAKLAHGITAPLNIYQIEEQLQLLRQDPRIERANGDIQAGAARGESRLVVRLVERHPFVLGAQYDNYHSPALGAQGGAFDAAWTNITGYGDSLGVTYDITRGLDDLEATYRLPLGPWGTELDVRMRKTWNDVVNPPDFKDLNISSKTTTWAVTLSQSILRRRNHDLSFFVTGERRRTKSELEPGGINIAFPSEGADEDGRTKLTLIRFGGDYLYRGQSQVLAFRSTFTVGIDALDATRNGSNPADRDGDIPDGRFLSWLGQAQYAQRLPFLDSRLVARFDIQLADDPLLGIEQFAVGGHDSVRGYRENQQVRDQGLAGSVEWRWPVWRGGRGYPEVELAPFFDIGHSWDTGRGSIDAGRDEDDPESARGRLFNGKSDTLISPGVALRIAFTRFLLGELSWAARLEDVDNTGDNRLQDNGVYFRIRMDLP